MFLQQQKYYV
jgi:hypothetical protein